MRGFDKRISLSVWDGKSAYSNVVYHLSALGNGAPDVSAVVNAIKATASEGIQLSLGELTGGGMFVQTVVVGRIVFIGKGMLAGKKKQTNQDGVTCREELMRDIAMYTISAGYVLWMCSRRVIYYRHVIAMFILYCGYVTVVVSFEVHRYYTNAEGAITGEDTTIESTEPQVDVESVALIGDASSVHNEDDLTLELSPSRRRTANAAYSTPSNIRRDPPGSKHSNRIIKVIERQKERQQQRRKGLEHPNSTTNDLQNHNAETQNNARPLTLGLFVDALRELGEHFYEVLYTDVWSNKELSTFEWCCSLLESPFVVIRKIVTPIPCEGDYNRVMVASSIALSPIWIVLYISTKLDDFDPFCIDAEDGTSCFPSVIWPCCISFVIGYVVLRYAPSTGTTIMPLKYTLPIALYGFVIAASWIDVISDQLVNVLEFIGVILRIPAPIMGMTVLAWGNSVGDFTTNGALAQKGLADMR